MWFSDARCGLVRLAPDGTLDGRRQARSAPRPSSRPTPPAACGSPPRRPGAGHVAADGRVKMLKREASDGAGRRGRARRQRLFATGTLLRSMRASRTERSPGSARRCRRCTSGSTPPAGCGLQPARLQHTTLERADAGRCDDTPPGPSIVPDPSKPISLATLRRQRGFKITVREPFAIESYVFDTDADETVAGVRRRHRAPRPHRAAPGADAAAARDRAAQGHAARADGDVRDREGNYAGSRARAALQAMTQDCSARRSSRSRSRRPPTPARSAGSRSTG